MRGAGSYSLAAGRELTPRMLDVLRSAGQGHSVKETALELGVSRATVRAVRAAAFARLDVANITAAVVEARRRGARL